MVLLLSQRDVNAMMVRIGIAIQIWYDFPFFWLNYYSFPKSIVRSFDTFDTFPELPYNDVLMGLSLGLFRVSGAATVQ